MNADTTLWFCDLVIGLVDFLIVLAIVLPIGGLLMTLALLAFSRKSKTAAPAVDAGFSEPATTMARNAPRQEPVAGHPLVGCMR